MMSLIPVKEMVILYFGIWGLFVFLLMIRRGFTGIHKVIVLLVYLAFCLVFSDAIVESLSLWKANWLQSLKNIYIASPQILFWFLVIGWPVIVIQAFYGLNDLESEKRIRFFLYLTILYFVLVGLGQIG